MSTTPRTGLVPVMGLTQGELKEIEQLARSCNLYEHLDLKLNWETLKSRPKDKTNDFLYYEQGQLLGYLAIFSFNSREAELSGMVHLEQRRRGIFTRLYQAAYSECQQRGLQTLLLIVERASASGQAFVTSLQPRYDHSEYKMVLTRARLPERYNPRLHFRQAGAEDVPVLNRLTAQAFGMPEEEIDWYAKQITQDAQRRFYVMELDGIIIGKIDVSIGENSAWIYGFGVAPEQRGKGYGRQLLAWTIQQVQEKEQIALEVAVENDHALGLYQSCGFSSTGCYDYYGIEITALSL